MKTIIFLGLGLWCSLAHGQETFTVTKIDTVKQEYSVRALSEQRARLVQSAKELRLEIQKVDSLLKIGGVIIEKQKKLYIIGNVGIGNGMNCQNPGELLEISTKSPTINN